MQPAFCGDQPGQMRTCLLCDFLRQPVREFKVSKAFNIKVAIVHSDKCTHIDGRFLRWPKIPDRLLGMIQIPFHINRCVSCDVLLVQNFLGFGGERMRHCCRLLFPATLDVAPRIASNSATAFLAAVEHLDFFFEIERNLFSQMKVPSRESLRPTRIVHWGLLHTC